LIAIMLAVVVGMAALAIDGSRAYALRRDLQAALDAAALAAGDKLQQSGSYTSAEQAATTIFGTNLRLYNPPGCSGYGTPGAGSVTVTCTFTGGTVLTQVVSALGPQGGRFILTATSSLQLQFAKVLTNGSNPILSSTASGGVNNLLYTPAVAALDQAGCGGAGGTALSISGSGTLSVSGDVVSSGAISVSGASMVVAGDIYARCQSPVPGSVVNVCYPSGSFPSCTYPDVAGATRSGYRFVDPNYPPPSVAGGSQGAPGSTVELPSGVYAANPNFSSGDCWFLRGGVFDWQGGYKNSGDFVSNELKPPDEPVAFSNTTVSSHQFWNTNGVNCAGAFQLSTTSGGTEVDNGNWGIQLTSVRTDTYAGNSYLRESAPSACRSIHAPMGDVLQIQVSNVPGATSYNVYASPLNNGCNGPWGLAGNIPVVGTVSNNNTSPCPAFTGAGCTLGHETAIFDGTILSSSFAPSSLASPETFEAYPPDPETAPLSASLPNQNPPQSAGAAGDRANENSCESTSEVWVTCPSPVTPGAVVFYLPSGGCLNATNSSDTYVFSGNQYDWISIYEPGAGHPTANTCSNALGGSANSAFIGLVYVPSASISVTSAAAYESPATGGLIGDFVTFSGTMPSITYSSAYAPVGPASRLIS
jgi:hypothetical protein